MQHHALLKEKLIQLQMVCLKEYQLQPNLISPKLRSQKAMTENDLEIVVNSLYVFKGYLDQKSNLKDVMEAKDQRAFQILEHVAQITNNKDIDRNGKLPHFGTW